MLQSLLSCFHLLSRSLLLAGRSVRGQTLKPSSHPNHYIILIDSSGSMVSSGEKKSAFVGALYQSLLQKLYQGGFGETIPTYLPDQDYMTFITLALLRVSNQLRTVAWPTTNLLKPVYSSCLCSQKKESLHRFYERESSPFSFIIHDLSWAKQLALRQSRLSFRQHKSAHVPHHGSRCVAK